MFVIIAFKGSKLLFIVVVFVFFFAGVLILVIGIFHSNAWLLLLGGLGLLGFCELVFSKRRVEWSSEAVCRVL